MFCRSPVYSTDLHSPSLYPDLQYEPTHKVDGSESTAIQRLVNLKQELRSLDPESFWRRFTEGVTSICGAQYVFVARRVATDEPAKDIEGRRPCLFGNAFYYNDGLQSVGLHRNKYFCGGNPMSHMDHQKQKPCLIPDNLGSLTSFGPDKLPFPAEGYLAVPLFSERKCLAHLGLMWSESGLRKRVLSWSLLEMVLYSLEDLVVKRVLDEKHEDMKLPGPQKSNGHPLPVHLLKPFARSLSHELRTPMQGIVGMLDVMYATVLEAMDDRSPAKTDYAFRSLSENIEMVQGESAGMSVNAANNIRQRQACGRGGGQCGPCLRSQHASSQDATV